MGILQDYLDDVQDLIDNKCLTEKEMVEAFSKGLRLRFQTLKASRIDKWISENYFRRTYSTQFSSRITGKGDYSYQELEEMYENKYVPEVLVLTRINFYDWMHNNFTRKPYSVNFKHSVKESDGLEFSFEELVVMYNKAASKSVSLKNLNKS
jgi:hypothetical protein